MSRKYAAHWNAFSDKDILQAISPSASADYSVASYMIRSRLIGRGPHNAITSAQLLRRLRILERAGLVEQEPSIGQWALRWRLTAAAAFRMARP